MELPANYWPDIRNNCDTILADLPITKVYPIPLLLRSDWRRYDWPGAMDETVYLDQMHERYLPVGRWALDDTTTHEFAFVGQGTFRSIWFDPHEERILLVKHGLGEDRFKVSGSDLSKARYNRRDEMWPVRPRDYERLYDEFGRGALHRQTGRTAGN